MKKLIINDRDIGSYASSWRDARTSSLWFDMGEYAVVVSAPRINTLCWGDGDEPTVILLD